MTAACSIYLHDTDRTPRRPSAFPRLLLAIVIVAIVFGAHAIIKHGADAQLVRQCMSEGRNIQTWEDSFGRKIQVCEIEPGLWGLMVSERVDGAWKEVTSFVKRNAKTLADVEHYISNSRAVLVWLR
jgi:hypothetical protein